MGSLVTDVVDCCAALHTQLDVLQNGEQGVQPSYESTYHEVHKQELDRVRSCVQSPPPGTFMHSDVYWASHTRVKGRRSDPRTPASVSVAYIPWTRVHDFVKGEEARADGPCKFVCQGRSSHKQGELKFPHWNSYSSVIRYLCNMYSHQHCACSTVTSFEQVRSLLQITLSNTPVVDPTPDVQVSLPVWTNRQCVTHPTGYDRHVPQETEARCERQIRSKWKGSHRSTHIREDARIRPTKGVPMLFCREATVLGAFGC